MDTNKLTKREHANTHTHRHTSSKTRTKVKFSLSRRRCTSSSCPINDKRTNDHFLITGNGSKPSISGRTGARWRDSGGEEEGRNKESWSTSRSPPCLTACLSTPSIALLPPPPHTPPPPRHTHSNANRFGCQPATRHPGGVVLQGGQLSANTLLPLHQSPFKLAFY